MTEGHERLQMPQTGQATPDYRRETFRNLFYAAMKSHQEEMTAIQAKGIARVPTAIYS